MKKDEVKRLIQRYLSARQAKRDPYFDPDELDDLLNALEDSEDYTYYDEILNAGLRIYPGNENLLLRKVQHLLYNESYKFALELLETVPNTQNLEVILMRMESYCGLNNYKEVLRITDNVLKDGLDSVEEEYMFQYIGSVLFDMGMEEETEDYLRKGLKRLPDSLVLKREMCYLLEAGLNLNEALTLCEELIDKEPYSFDSWFIMGHLQAVSFDFEKAIESLDFAIVCNNGEIPGEVTLLKIYCLFMNENYEKAIEVYRELKPEKPHRQLLRPMIAECNIKLEHYEEAYQLLKMAIAEGMEFDDYIIYVHFLHCCVQTGRKDELTQMLALLSEKKPKDVYTLSVMALAYLESGNEEGAGELVEQILELLDNDSEHIDRKIEMLKQNVEVMSDQWEIDYTYILFPLQSDFERKLLSKAEKLRLDADLWEIRKDKSDIFNKYTAKEKEDIMRRMVKNVGDYDLKSMQRPATKLVPIENLLKEYFKNKENHN